MNFGTNSTKIQMVKVLQTTGALTAAGELFQRHLTHPPFIALLLHTPLLSITSQQTNTFLVGTSSAQLSCAELAGLDQVQLALEGAFTPAVVLPEGLS